MYGSRTASIPAIVAAMATLMTVVLTRVMAVLINPPPKARVARLITAPTARIPPQALARAAVSPRATPLARNTESTE